MTNTGTTAHQPTTDPFAAMRAQLRASYPPPAPAPVASARMFGEAIAALVGSAR